MTRSSLARLSPSDDRVGVEVVELDLRGHYSNSWHTLGAQLQGLISDEDALPQSAERGFAR